VLPGKFKASVPLAFCTISWRREKTLAQILEIVRPFAFRGIELWRPHLSGSGPAEARGLIEDHGLFPLCLSLPWGERFWELGESLVREALECGARGIKVFGEIRDDRADLVRKLKAFCQKARDAGLEVYIENHGNQPHDTMERTLEILESVGEPNFRLIFDLYNAHEMGEDVEKAFSSGRAFIRHLHVKWGRRDEKNAYVPLPLSQSPLSYGKVLAALGERPVFCSLEMASGPAMLREGADFINKKAGGFRG